MPTRVGILARIRHQRRGWAIHMEMNFDLFLTPSFSRRDGGDCGGLASYLGACLHRQRQILLYVHMYSLVGCSGV